MNLFRTFLIVLLTSLMAIAKTGYAAASDVPSTTHAKENVLSQNDLGHVASFEKGHQLLDNHLLGIDLEEEEEDSKGKKRLGHLLSCSISFESAQDITPNRLGCTCTIKGISEMQSIRLHLIHEKFQI